jgi:serine/threonine-protein kinase
MTQQGINNASMLKVGTILRGTYRIDSYLSSGGFGNTYVATNVEFDERVAIKEFFMKGVTQRDDNQTTVSVSNLENTNSFQEQKEKFKKEARRLRKLQNEHIVKVHDMFDENGTAYYVMDYVDGENLSERLKRTGKPMTEQEVRDILPQILDALKSVHDAGIWHLDLKPANIMVDKAGNVKLIDFGASKQLNAQKGGATTSTAISYTNGYAPREQMEQNYDKFGPWTDIYALGATLYNLLTNKRPPLPTDIDDDISEDKHEALPFPEGVGGLKFLVLQMMKTNRMQRPQSIDAIMEAEKMRKEEPKQAPKQQFTPKPSAVYDDEETIIAEPKPKREEKKPEPKPEPKVFSQPTQSSYTRVSNDNNDGDSSGKGIIIAMIIAILIVIIFANYRGCGNKVQEANVENVESSSPKTVEKMGWDSPIGYCQYSGPVDENQLPDGRGKADFSDGRYYKGDFEHGELTGDNCFFMYSNGDVFEGKFRNNRFYYGKYTINKDKSYFVGRYNENGQPSSGTWYNKNGKEIEKI